VVQVDAQALEQLGRACLYDGFPWHKVVAGVRRHQRSSGHQFVGAATVIVGHVQSSRGGRPTDAIRPTNTVDVGVGVYQWLPTS